VRDAKATTTAPARPDRRDLRRQRIEAKQRFQRTRQAERGFSRHLRQVAKQVGSMVTAFSPRGVVERQGELSNALHEYAKLIRPWATAVATRMMEEVDQRDKQAWRQLARTVGRELGDEVNHAATGQYMRALLEEQVELITSLPRKAAERVHKLTVEGMSNGRRAKEVAAEILRTGHVTESRAMLIARTETTRTASALVQARAEHVGSLGYFWRTAEDSDVREEHRKLNGRYFRWDKPPISGSNGERAHPGMIYNCRCYPEPVLQDVD
jgi:SPP1 gp7 family putative phage head morphogenesis protein